MAFLNISEVCEVGVGVIDAGVELSFRVEDGVLLGVVAARAEVDSSEEADFLINKHDFFMMTPIEDKVIWMP